MHQFIIHVCAKEPALCRSSSPQFSLFDIFATVLGLLGSERLYGAVGRGDTRNATANASAWGGGRARTPTSFWGPAPLALLSLGIEKTDEFKPTTSRPPALHLQPYSSVSVWRGTEGGGVDAHRKRHLNQDYLTPSNKKEGACGCCLDLMTCSAKH